MFSNIENFSSPRFFITGTDTGIGKTYATCALLQYLQQHGKKAIGIKPILTGQENPSDTDLFLQHNSISLNKSFVTPYHFSLATSPHIAAAHEKKDLSIDEILSACQPALSQAVDVILIEGIGGWQVPINTRQTTADLAAAFNCPIILVVGLRLGCLNHALLSVESIQNAGLTLQGYIINQIDPTFEFKSEYIQTLNQKISAPLLGLIPNEIKA